MGTGTRVKVHDVTVLVIPLSDRRDRRTADYRPNKTSITPKGSRTVRFQVFKSIRRCAWTLFDDHFVDVLMPVAAHWASSRLRYNISAFRAGKGSRPSGQYFITLFSSPLRSAVKFCSI